MVVVALSAPVEPAASVARFAVIRPGPEEHAANTIDASAAATVARVVRDGSMR
ncbi:MAG: hypothetical protein V9E99_06315 [Microthrixaceae bacterium]